MKNIALFTLVLAVCLSLTASAHAQNTTSQLRKDAAVERKALQQEMKDTKKEAKESGNADHKNHARLKNADLTAISGTTLTVTKDGKTYTVTTSATTKIHRHFGGTSSLTEFSVGNKLDINGTYTDDTKTAIAATFIRNNSIMKRRGTFVGEVVSLNGTTLVLKTVHRGNQTVTLDATTKYVNRKEVALTAPDILVGHRIRVKGMWDKANNTVTQVTQVKDFTLPAKVSGTVTPSTTITATP